MYTGIPFLKETVHAIVGHSDLTPDTKFKFKPSAKKEIFNATFVVILYKIVVLLMIKYADVVLEFCQIISYHLYIYTQVSHRCI